MKRFISFLGTGNYLPCVYRMGDKTSPTVIYVQTATNLFADPRCGEAVVFCTEEASAKHWEGLLAEFVQNGLPSPRKVPIPDGASEGELWEIFRIVRDVVAEGDEIVFDVTHSLRSLPVVATVLLRYLAVAKGVSLGACLYGAWDKRDKEANLAPIFDLTPFFALDDWTRAIHDFEAFGDPAVLQGLASNRLRPLCREPGKARTLNETIRKMAEFARNVRLANLGVPGRDVGIRNMKLQSCIARVLSEEGVSDAVPELGPVLKRVGDDFGEFGDGDLRNGFRAARWAAAHGLLPQAYTLLQETIVSFVLESRGDLIPESKSGIEARSFVSNVLGTAAGAADVWSNWTPREDVPAGMALAETLPEGMAVNYGRLKKLRNAINHAGTNPQEPVNAQSRDFLPDTFFALADAFENALFPTTPTP